MNINKKHKDRLFRLVFQKKEDLLTLYNAVNGSHYQDAEELEITTLDDVIYMGMKNDISFMINDILNLWEHQSTINPNMPLRGLFYFSRLYQKYVDAHGLNIYSEKQQKIPMPQYIVFYNGQETDAESWDFKLSDAFIFPHNSLENVPCMEITAHVLNINKGKNQSIMEQCQKLKEYAEFIDEIRKQKASGLNVTEAVDAAVRNCIKRGILSDLLSAHRAEVLDVILTEYDEEKYRALERKEWMEEGREEGKAEGKAESILEFLEDCSPVPEELRQRVMEERDVQTLSRWLRLAARAKTIDEFIQNMK